VLVSAENASETIAPTLAVVKAQICDAVRLVIPTLPKAVTSLGVRVSIFVVLYQGIVSSVHQAIRPNRRQISSMFTAIINAPVILRTLHRTTNASYFSTVNGTDILKQKFRPSS